MLSVVCFSPTATDDGFDCLFVAELNVMAACRVSLSSQMQEACLVWHFGQRLPGASPAVSIADFIFRVET